MSALAAYDLDADGIPELISCWSNGALTVRSEFNGVVIYRDTFSAPIAAAIDAVAAILPGRRIHTVGR